MLWGLVTSSYFGRDSSWLYGGNRRTATGFDNVDDPSVLVRWGYDPARHPDLRSDEALRRWAYVFTADADRTWFIEVDPWLLPYYAGPPDARDISGWGPDRYRIWIQRLDPVQDDLLVEERFDYPRADQLTVERGATVYREFIVREADGQAFATDVTASLNPAGTCENPEPGRLRCSIPTADLTPGVREFRFGSATHGDHSEATAGWPRFSFTLQERDIATKAQVTLEASAKAQIVKFLQGAVEDSLSIEFHPSDAITLESGQAVSFGGGTSAGVGAGVKLGFISPRARAELEGSLDVRAYETLAIGLPDPGEEAQQVALASFLANSVITYVPILEPILTVVGSICGRTSSRTSRSTNSA